MIRDQSWLISDFRLVQVQYTGQHGVCSSIGRASVCGTEGNGIETHHIPKRIYNGQGLGK